ncbi:MAG: hypothetical protein LWW93_12050 [Hyphomicrobiales bacterium]|nr:hypothetical protein [Hyphomicrobiales bacterium]
MNTLVIDYGGRIFVADVRLDLERDLLVAIVRAAPIHAEAADVAGLRRALEVKVDEYCSTTTERPEDAVVAPAQMHGLPDPGLPSAAVLAHIGRAIGALPRSEPAAAAMRTLLPGATSLHIVPQAWKPWRSPDPATALDAIVDTLVKKSKVKAGNCPFWRARVLVVHAVDAAEEALRRYAAARDDGASKRDRLRALAMSAGRLEDALTKHAGIFDGAWPILFEGWRDATREGVRANRLTGDATAVPGLRQRLADAIADAIADARLVAEVSRVVGEAVANSEADAGKRAFIACMLMGFREIVGEPRGDGAVDFVDAAAEVAGLRIEGHKIRGRSWRATTRKILSEPYFVALRTPFDCA